MENFVKKVIRASAGTGKTYRLSLEYIGLLLKFRAHHLHFREILVITFTKKATAEIRERIFQHLEAIVRQTPAGAELCKNLHAVTGITIAMADRHYLESVLQEMLLNKKWVRISTIDAFTNEIFKTIIAPFLGLTVYDIDESLEDELLARLYQTLLENENNLNLVRSFFQRSGKKNIQDYQKLIESILKNRWIFYFIQQFPEPEAARTDREQLAKQALTHYQENFCELIDKFQGYLNRTHMNLTADQALKKYFFTLISAGEQKPDITEIAAKTKHCLADPDFILAQQKLLLGIEPFWNGSRLLRKKEEQDLAAEFKKALEIANGFLADYLLFTALLPEQQDIINLAQVILNQYDEIKFREKIFTFTDISYYTFKYLYHPELSLIEQDSVTNAFYEYLTGVIRFILIDEFQDTSAIQFKILLPIIKEVTSGYGVKEYGGVIVVGDEKQSIYGWRGGERDLLLKMPEILGDAEQITLATSYRSEAIIINFINSVFGYPMLHKILQESQIRWSYDPITTTKSTSTGNVRISFRNYSHTRENHNNLAQSEDALREFITQVVAPLLKDRQISAHKSAILARKNQELQSMAVVLDELGIDYVLESSHSILIHRAIKPITYLFQFLVYGDVTDLLKFLRSDYILLNPDQLKNVLLHWRDRDQTQGMAPFFRSLQAIPAMARLGRLLGHFESKAESNTPIGADRWHNLLDFSKNVFETFNVISTFNQENDLKNISTFLEIIAEFENSNHSFPKDLSGFWAYCQANADKEAFQQPMIEASHAISLMTIHKSKGLEFDNVFLYHDLASRSGQHSGQLNCYLEYSAEYHQIENYILTFNLDPVLEFSQLKELSIQKAMKEKIEELNNFYVAITRARANLFLYFALKHTTGVAAYFDDVSETVNPEIDNLLAATIFRLLQENLAIEPVQPHFFRGQFGQLVNNYTARKVETAKLTFPVEYLDFDRSKFLFSDPVEQEKTAFLDFKTVYVEKKNIDRGNIAHFYLSFIRYGTPVERSNALNRTISHFGSLLPDSEIKDLIDQVDRFIDSQPEIFARDKWQKVFTEYTIFSPSGQELRLDRLMIDEVNKEIRIIDFKTGESFEPFQMESYLKAVRALGAVEKGEYQVRGDFVELGFEP